ncbi:protein ImuA [Bosea sp. AK1]|uniref:ImuA family protein n=1 Tax=Bosea sp. AK1 TaxID=2587160 RepID=UPI0011732E17|nr:hypothetical protein [Bosea sp. AK1]TQI76617.1 protein ImuA [Bosea sp. AK1]
MPEIASTLSDLRRSLSEAALRGGPVAAGRIGLGVPALDEALNGGLARAALHEVYAAEVADLAAATGFALGLALRAGVADEKAGAFSSEVGIGSREETRNGSNERSILWARQDFVDAEAGRLHAPGLNEFGLDPSRLLLVRARDGEGVLRAGAEAARCAALGAVLIEPWGEPRPFDLTASRRLALAAEASGVPVLLLRVAATEAPSAARTRWQVRALASRALEANAPGAPAFALRLLRQRGGAAEREWRVEWDRDRHCFAERSLFDRASRTDHAAPLSRPLVPLPGDGQIAADGRDSDLRRAG